MSVLAFERDSKRSASQETIDRDKALQGTPLERARFVQCIIIELPAFTEALALAEALISRCGALGDPGGFLIVGESGSGKSSILDRLKERHPDIDVADEPRKPIIYIELDTAPTEGQIADRMLQALDYGFPLGRKSLVEKTEILCNALRVYGTLLIIVDETQHTVEGKREILAIRIADWFKRLYDRVQIPLLFSGTELAERLFELNPQLGTRVTGRFALKPLSFDSLFIGLLAAYDKAIPMPVSSGLYEINLAKRIHEATGGNLRILKKLIREAVMISSQEEALKVEQAHFYKAYSMVRGNNSNPFSA